MAAPPRTIGDVLEYLRGDRDLAALAQWPPDVFAVTGVLLSQSGAFRLVVSPDAGQSWPPVPDWEECVRKVAAEWRKAAQSSQPLPSEVSDLVEVVLRNLDSAVHGISSDWQLACALLRLHVIADETGAGVATKDFDDYTTALLVSLGDEGTLSRLPVDRIRVMPKLRTSFGGMTVRSLSRYLAFLNADMETSWIRQVGQTILDPTISRILVVPWPDHVFPSDFDSREDLRPLQNMDEDRFRFFSFKPKARVNVDAIAELVDQAIARVGGVDAIVFPEASLTVDEADAVEQIVQARNVTLVLAGIRESPENAFGANYVRVGVATVAGPSGSTWQHYSQDKHHRWCLDGDQIQQYHLGATLHPKLRWWEAIAIPPRRRLFIEATDKITMCPVICEDLARIDPAGDSVHAVAPTLVVALLLDGPQLESRWPARYASVLADDPGSSVLSVTSLGMALRSRPAKTDVARTIALWKDRRRGVRQIDLDQNHDAVVLTLCIEPGESVTADGRRDNTNTYDLVLAGVEQLSLSEGTSLSVRDTRGGPGAGPSPQGPMVSMVEKWLGYAGFRRRIRRPTYPRLTGVGYSANLR